MGKHISISGTAGAFMTVIGGLIFLVSLPLLYLPGIGAGLLLALIGMVVK